MCTCFTKKEMLHYLFGAPLYTCRSGRPDAHQAMDAILEELNKLVKAWMCGETLDSDAWRRVIRNLNKLLELRDTVSNHPHLLCSCGSLPLRAL